MNILLTGGSACGKSALGEQLAQALGAPRYYLAAMEPWGEEGRRRVARHRALRADKGFRTLERYRDLDRLTLPQADGTVLLECLGNLTANELFRPDKDPARAAERVLAGVYALARQARHLILISNEVGSDGMLYPPETENYIQTLGQINQELTAWADRAAEVVCGLALWLK